MRKKELKKGQGSLEDQARNHPVTKKNTRLKKGGIKQIIMPIGRIESYTILTAQRTQKDFCPG